MVKPDIIFCGLSKNGGYELIENINFLEQFINYSSLNIKILNVDTDSKIEVKDFLEQKSKSNINIKTFNEDGLDYKIESRLERITTCRNTCLKYIYKNFDKNNAIYIPFDQDIDLFSNINLSEFEKLIVNFISNEHLDAVFPFSYPNYYDILALRAKNWVNFNSQLINHKLKKYFRIGSFIFNYLFVFRYQWREEKIRKKNIEVYSAFGGIGMYKLSKINYENFYKTKEKNKEFVSEHIEFNKLFKHKKILLDWKIKAPDEHINFHKMKNSEKIIYFFKTLKSDLGI